MKKKEKFKIIKTLLTHRRVNPLEGDKLKSPKNEVEETGRVYTIEQN